MKITKPLIAYLFGRKKPCPDFDFHHVQSILIYPLGDAVGDAIINTVYAHQLRQIYPHARLGIIVTDRNREILTRCPDFDELIENKWIKLLQQRKKWDLILDFYESFHSKEMIIFKILAAKAVMIFKKKEKPHYHFKNIKNYDFYCPYNANNHVCRHLNTSKFAEFFPIPDPKISFKINKVDENLIHCLWQSTNKIHIFIAPQGSVAFKQISPNDLANLLNGLDKSLRSVTRFILCHTKNSIAYFNQLKQLCNNDLNINLSPPTNLQQYIDLVASADLIISVDSGTAHLACALQRPLLSFYVEHNIHKWAPLHTHHVTHFMMVAQTHTHDLDDEYKSWSQRGDFPISDGIKWLNQQIHHLITTKLENNI